MITYHKGGILQFTAVFLFRSARTYLHGVYGEAPREEARDFQMLHKTFLHSLRLTRRGGGGGQKVRKEKKKRKRIWGLHIFLNNVSFK